MIEPAIFALIRDGQTTLYSDPCGSAFFERNLVWGQDGLGQWLRGREPTDQFDSDAEAGAVIDFDAKALLWYTDDDEVNHPRSVQLLDALIDHAWPDFEILYADGISDLQIAAGGSINQLGDRAMRLRVDLDPLERRSDSIEEEIELGDELGDEFDLDDGSLGFAWITILDQENVVHHRLIGEITLDVIRDERKPLERLIALPPYEVPAETNVMEGLIVDEASCEIRIWGSRNIRAVAKEMALAWPQWDVKAIDSDGYQQQCRISGPAGRPMSNAQALGSVIPVLLMTKRVDPAMVLGQIGKSVKGLVAKLIAFLTVLFCLPFAIFALVTGNWKSGGITIGIIVLLVTVVFKLIEAKWRRGFTATMQEVKRNAASQDDGSAVAGPTDSTNRRNELERLLRTADMPSIAEIEPHFKNSFLGVR